MDPVTGAVGNRYLNGAAVDELLARTDASGNSSWYLTDRLGSVRQVADGSGGLTYSADYDAFGRQVSATGQGGDRFGYTGRDTLHDLGLQWNRARWYQPAWGRFTSEDPLGLASGDSNLYRYVGNQPTNSTDPGGLKQGFSAALNVPTTMTLGTTSRSKPRRLNGESERRKSIASLMQPTFSGVIMTSDRLSPEVSDHDLAESTISWFLADILHRTWPQDTLSTVRRAMRGSVGPLHVHGGESR